MKGLARWLFTAGYAIVHALASTNGLMQLLLTPDRLAGLPQQDPLGGQDREEIVATPSSDASPGPQSLGPSQAAAAPDPSNFTMNSTGKSRGPLLPPLLGHEEEVQDPELLTMWCLQVWEREV